MPPSPAHSPPANQKVAMVQLDLGFTKQLMSFATSIPPACFWYNSLRNIECKCYQIHSCKMSFFDINANAINIFVKPVPMVLIMSDHLCIDQLTLMLDWWISQPNMTTILAAFFCMLIISEWVNLLQNHTSGKQTSAILMLTVAQGFCTTWSTWKKLRLHMILMI